MKLITNQHHSYWENPSNNRYYMVILQQDLLQDWILSICYGRKGTKLGCIKHQLCLSKLDGMRLIDKLKKVRIAHGYHEHSTESF